MSHGGDPADPRNIHDASDLARAFTHLRRRAARQGQVRLSIRDLSTRTGRSPSTLHPYLRGDRLCPADTYESLLRALGVAEQDLRPWLDAWDRIADDRSPSRPPDRGTVAGRSVEPTSGKPGHAQRRPTLLPRNAALRYRVGPKRRRPPMIGIVTGDIRRVRNVDVWVNSENTGMQMARFDEYAISAIIRFDGASLDESGRVIDDRIASELTARLAGRVPVAPGTAITTGPGQLERRYGVRYVIHVAAVHGEPGEGYRQITDVARAVANVLAEAERLGPQESPVRTILFPLLGVGTGGGDLEATAVTMVGAVVDHLMSWPNPRLAMVWLLASTADELTACRAAMDADPRLAERLS